MARKKVINKGQNSDLIGGNFTNAASETVFSLGNFSVSSNLTGRRETDYSNVLSSFVKPITLETLGLSEADSEKVFNFTSNVKLNFDKSDLKSYVKFGSGKELFRVTIQNIISKYPASLFVNSQATIGGNITVRDFIYDDLTDTSIFKIPSPFISNPFTIIFNDGNGSVPNDNELRNLNLTFGKYVIWRKDDPNNNTHYIQNFTGDSETTAFINVRVTGNPFPEIASGVTTGNTDYHLKPEPLQFNKFYADRNQIERYFIGNRLPDQSGFEFNLKDPTILESGSLLYSERKVKWDTPDGYNIIIGDSKFNVILTSILNIGEKYDSVKTNLIARFLTPSSIKVYDYTDEGKMTKLLNIYGREFDELRVFIDSLININSTTYDKKNNIPDMLVKNLAKTFGWDVFNLVSESDITESFFSTEAEQTNSSLLPSEIDIELWRRILINTNYYWKAKGTRHAIKSIFQLIGIPEPFINITEYVYTVEGKIDPNEVELSLEDLPSASYPFNSEGYPIAPVETDDFYFQISGNSDSGQAYINNYRNVGFNVNRVVDNKKSWVQDGFVERTHSTTPNYFQQDSKLLINTKEVDVTLDVARAIEYDVYCYNKEIDAIFSSAVTKPYLYVNIDLQYTGDTMTFQLPEQPLSGSNVQMNFNGHTLTPVGVGSGDYTYNALSNEISLISESAITHSSGNQDVITITYLYDRLGSTGYTNIQYLVQAPVVQAAGTILQLPSEPKGDIQLVLNGQSLTKGTTLFVGDFIIDPNDRTRIIIQNTDLQLYLLTNPVVRVWYIKDGNNASNAEKRSEAHRVDSLSGTKVFYSAGINRVVYTLDFIAFDIDAIKITVNGITLQNGIDFTLNPLNKKQIYIKPSINFGDVIGAYYIIDDGSVTAPLLPPDPILPDVTEMSFLEYLELINRRLINVKNRKVVTDNLSGYYPTVRRVYDEYLRRSFLPDSDPIQSNGYTFKNLYPFINQYNAFFNRFISQLLPATIILRKEGILIRNTAFTKQKFKYRRGVNFNTDLRWLGDDGSEHLVEVAPAPVTTTTTTTVAPTTTTTISPTTTTTVAPTTTTTTAPLPTLIVVGGNPNSEILRSVNGGVSWTKVVDQGGNSLQLEAINFFDSQIGIAVGLGGTVWRTTDGGINWNLIGEFGGTPILPSATNTLRAAKSSTSINMYISGNGNFIYKTNDSGLNWTETSVINHISKGIYAFNSTNSVSVGLLASNKIVRTTNGSTWANIPSAGSGNFNAVDFFGNSTTSAIGFAVTNTGGIFKSVDSGLNWSILPAPPVSGTFIDVQMLTDNLIYISGWRIVGINVEIIVLKTIDGGSNWVNIGSTIPNTLNANSGKMIWKDEFNGWVTDSTGLLHGTINGGLTWTTSTITGLDGTVGDITII